MFRVFFLGFVSVLFCCVCLGFAWMDCSDSLCYVMLCAFGWLVLVCFGFGLEACVWFALFGGLERYYFGLLVCGWCVCWVFCGFCSWLLVCLF